MSAKNIKAKKKRARTAGLLSSTLSYRSSAVFGVILPQAPVFGDGGVKVPDVLLDEDMLAR